MAGLRVAAVQCDQAAQLMPPPRFPRHLRPCHPPVTAKQVRCVHATSRASLSTAGVGTPQPHRAKGDNGESSAPSGPAGSSEDVPAEDKPWWKKLFGRIASFGAHGDPPATIESKPETASPYPTHPGRPGARLHQADGATEQEERGPIHAAARSAKRRQDGGTQDGGRKPARRRQDHVQTAQQTGFAAMQQQIQQLSDQVRALQAHLEANQKKEQSSSAPAAVTHTPTMKPHITQLNRKSQDMVLGSPNEQRIHVSRSNTSREFAPLFNFATSSYERSVRLCGETAQVLTRLPSRAVVPIAPSILRRFRTIHRIAMMDDDEKVSTMCFKFQSTLNSLAFTLRKSRVAVPGPADPLVASDVANYNKMLFNGDPIAHALNAGRKRYFLSTRILLDVETILETCRSPRLMSMANHVHEFLDTIAERAYLEGNRGFIRLLGHKRDMSHVLERVRQSALTKSPDVALKLELAYARRQIQLSSKILRALRKELWSILPTLPKIRYTKLDRAPLRLDKDVKAENVSDGDNGRRLVRRIHTQSRSMKSSTDSRVDAEERGLETTGAEKSLEVKDDMLSSRPSNAEASTSPAAPTTNLPEASQRSDEASGQSLLEELFPEANSTPQPRPVEKNRDQYPRLELPKSTPVVRPEVVERPRKLVEQAAESFQQRGEQIAVLQLTNCSTGLTEADFRRIIPKGKHLEGWRRDSDFYKVIPGRDPLSLERLPFYYLLFKNTEAAVAYQKNASRLHKLSARYQPSSILSAIPPPKGFLEDGEDITAAVSSYNLLPKNHSVSLNVLMQPYNPALRLMIERGGYQPIAPSVDNMGKRIWRVLLHIEGYEPSPTDLFVAISSDAYRQGTLLPLRHESRSSIHRLRDMINLKMSMKPVSSSRPRAYGTFDRSASPAANSTPATELTYDDPEIQRTMGGVDEDRSQAQLNQEIMNRVYNRWVLDFEDEHSARRWCLRWHRKVFPEPTGGDSAWKDSEEARICNTELLW
jgi:hypothetical protein